MATKARLMHIAYRYRYLNVIRLFRKEMIRKVIPFSADDCSL